MKYFLYTGRDIKRSLDFKGKFVADGEYYTQPCGAAYAHEDTISQAFALLEAEEMVTLRVKKPRLDLGPNEFQMLFRVRGEIVNVHIWVRSSGTYFGEVVDAEGGRVAIFGEGRRHALAEGYFMMNQKGFDDFAYTNKRVVREGFSSYGETFASQRPNLWLGETNS